MTLPTLYALSAWRVFLTADNIAFHFRAQCSSLQDGQVHGIDAVAVVCNDRGQL